MANYLFGNFKRTLDDKNRLSLPSKLLPKLSKVLYIMDGHNGVLSIYTEETFQQKMEDTMKLNREKRIPREIALAISASSDDIEIDGSNRIRLDNDVIERYHLKKDVTVVGNFDHLEIWNTEDWEKYYQEILNRYDENTEEYDYEK